MCLKFKLPTEWKSLIILWQFGIPREEFVAFDDYQDVLTKAEGSSLEENNDF